MIPLKSNVKSKSWPFMTWILVAANCYVFYSLARLRDPGLQQHFVDRWSVVPVHLFAHPSTQCITLITAMFLHAGWLHLISNMVFLLIFGGAVEDTMGHVKFPFFYLLTGVIANAAQALISPTANIPMVGASGAIAGVLGSFFFFYPYARVLTLIPLFILFTIREVPAFIFLGLWILMQTLNGMAMLSSQLVTRQTIGGVAWWAHAAGFLSGLLLSPAFGKRTGKYR